MCLTDHPDPGLGGGGEFGGNALVGYAVGHVQQLGCRTSPASALQATLQFLAQQLAGAFRNERHIHLTQLVRHSSTLARRSVERMEAAAAREARQGERQPSHSKPPTDAHVHPVITKLTIRLGT